MKSKLQEYKARFEFWWAKKTVKDGRDFSLSFDSNGMLVYILRGPFGGVQYRYANVQLKEDQSAMVDFSTVVVYNPNNTDLSDPKFVALTTNIFRIILDVAVSEHKNLTAIGMTEKVINENREVDISESNEERDFHEESTPLLEKRVSKRKPRKKTVSANSNPYLEVQLAAKPKRSKNSTPRKKRPNGK